MLFRSDRKSTRLNSSHTLISYAVFCLKKKNKQIKIKTSRTQECDTNVTESVICSTRPPYLFSYGTPFPSSLYFTLLFFFFFFNDTATTEIYPLSLHDALPISAHGHAAGAAGLDPADVHQLGD